MNEQFKNFCAQLEARNMYCHTIEHLTDDGRVRRVAINRPGRHAVYAMVSLAIDPRDGFSIYYLSPTNKIAEDVDMIEKMA